MGCIPTAVGFEDLHLCVHRELLCPNCRSELLQIRRDKGLWTFSVWLQARSTAGEFCSPEPRQTMSLREVSAMSRLAEALGAVVLLVSVQSASAVGSPVGLGTADSFAVLAGSTVTNTGSSTISGDVGVYPGTAVVGFPPGVISDGVIHAADAVALQAQSDTTTAYDIAAGRSTT